MLDFLLNTIFLVDNQVLYFTYGDIITLTIVVICILHPLFQVLKEKLNSLGEIN